MNHYISGVVLALSLGSVLVSCDDLLDQEPPSYLTPESYFKTEDQVMACANSFYNQLPSHGYGYGLYSSDVNTDNQAGSGSGSKYLDGQWKVGLTNGNWDFSTIRAINYKLNTCLTNYNNKKITGNISVNYTFLELGNTLVSSVYGVTILFLLWYRRIMSLSC